MEKYIFVTGGVCSSLGKGIAAASLGTLLECHGYDVCLIKVDPYLNVDAGTMSPYQHGEVYVTDDGSETDLDLGNYARFTSSPLSSVNSITSGQVYDAVIRRERKGDYLGKCVQVVPHITDEIISRIKAPVKEHNPDITIIEIGGTVGDIESIPFLEAVRQIIHEVTHENALSVHVTLVPSVIGGEIKSKPTQHSVKELRAIGIQPDILLCRTSVILSDAIKNKISLFTNIDFNSVISAFDESTSIYRIPLNFRIQGLDKLVCEKLRLNPVNSDFSEWERFSVNLESRKEDITLAMVGKYTEHDDAYKSLDEALFHGGTANNQKVNLVKIDSDRLVKTKSASKDLLSDVNGIVVPGGFGDRGIEGMILAAEFARKRKIPYLGICLGLHIMVIEYARNVLGLKDANSSEIDPESPHPVVILLGDQVNVKNYGGTMRKGRGISVLTPETNIHRAYGQVSEISERHRHRYEISNVYKDDLEKAGLVFSAHTVDGQLVEAAEWGDNPWSIGVQFHPEFTSRPIEPGSLFTALAKAAVEKRDEKKQ